jgi:hypothetical protein
MFVAFGNCRAVLSSARGSVSPNVAGAQEPFASTSKAHTRCRCRRAIGRTAARCDAVLHKHIVLSAARRGPGVFFSSALNSC